MHTLIKERCQNLQDRVRAPSKQRLLRRWWGLLGMATQRAVAHALFAGTNANLHDDLAKLVPAAADWVA